MALRVLLVVEDEARAAVLERGLREAGYEVIAYPGSGVDLLEQVRVTVADVIVIDRDSPDRDILEHICMVTRDAPRAVVLFTDDGDRETIRAAVRAGVSAYVVGGLSRERIRPILDVALTQFEERQALQHELEQARTTLAERKRIERAKGIVMKSRNVSEAEAYAALRKLAMDRNQRLVEVADNVISLAELLT